MDSFVNITGNLAAAPKDGSTWLIANGKTKYKCIWEGRTSLIGYDTLGISAEFRSWLNNYNDLNSGAYGIQIDIMSQKATSQTEGSPLYYTFYFSSKEMIGDPYNYDTFYLQEKTFDISGIKQIDAIRIGFFQDADFKSNTSGYLIAQEEDIQNANLFIKNPIVAIGYNANKFSKDTIILTTKDSEMYLTEPTELVKINYPNIDYENETVVQNLINTINTKNLNLRWVHLLTEEEQSGTYNVSSSGISATRVLTIADFADYNEPFSISWYRNIYDENTDYSNTIWDANAGEYWVEIENGYNKFDLQVIPDTKKPEEQYKAIVEYPSKESVLESIETYLSQPNGLYNLKDNLLKQIVEINNVNYLKNILLNSDTQTVLTNFNDQIYKPALEKLNALEYKDEDKIQELQDLIEVYNGLNSWQNDYNIQYIIYNAILDLYNLNISDFMLQLSSEIKTLKKNNIDDSTEFKALAQNIILSSSVFDNVRVLKLFFPQLMNNFSYLLNCNYDNYSTMVRNYLTSFKSIILKDANENASITNTQEKQALKIVQSIISEILDVENQIKNYRNTEIGNIQYFISEPIIFKNTDPTASLNVLKDALSNLEIVVDEYGYQGTYNLYEEDGHIQNDNDANEIRILEAKYEKYSSDSNPVANDEIITWRIPLINTMIQTPEEGVEYNQYDECTKTIYNANGVVTTEGEVTRENYMSSKYYYYDDTITPPKYIQITPESVAASNLIDFYNSIRQFYKRNNTKVHEENGYMIISRPGNPIQNFRIKPFCEASFTNNEIFCTVEKDLINLEASTSLSFSPVGNSGTNYTFYLEFYDNQNQFALQALGFSLDEVNKKKHELKVRARLFDEVHNEITHNQGMRFTWTLLGGTGAEINNVITAENVIRSKTPQAETWNPNIFSNLIIKCQCTTDIALGDYSGLMELDENGSIINNTAQNKTAINLTAYLSIPVIKNKLTIGGYIGSGLISYDNAGTNPFYYNGNFKVYGTNLQVINNGSWQIWGIELGEENYFPKITSTGSLSVPSIYLQEDKQVSIQYVINGVVEFILPLRVYKRVYASKVINAWDGSLTLNENDGIILSTMMGAGYKDNQNRFFGVLMGDMGPVGEDENTGNPYYTGTGIYGFNEGEKSFGFNINGNGFIGKMSSAQILFSGDQGKITCASYEAADGWENVTEDSGAGGGLQIDLDDGVIDLLGQKERYTNDENETIYGRSHIIIDANADDGAFFRITNAQKKDLMYIGGEISSNYFLKSANYNGTTINGIVQDDGTEGCFLNLKEGSFVANNAKLFGRLATKSTMSNYELYFRYHREGKLTGSAPNSSKPAVIAAYAMEQVDAEDWLVNMEKNQDYIDHNGSHEAEIILEDDAIKIISKYITSNSSQTYQNIFNTSHTFKIQPVASSLEKQGTQTYNGTYIKGTTLETYFAEYLSISGGPVLITNNLSVKGGLDVHNSSSIYGTLYVSSNLNANNLTLNNNLLVYNNLRVNNQLYVEMEAKFNDNVYMYYLDEASSMQPTSHYLYITSGGKVKIHTSSSSKKYKTNIEILNNEEIQKLYNIPVYTFQYKKDFLSEEDERRNKIMPGFIVEDWEEIMPIAVDHNTTRDGEARNMWNSQIIIPLMFQMIKNNHTEIQRLRQENQLLKEKIYENK